MGWGQWLGNNANAIVAVSTFALAIATIYYVYIYSRNVKPQKDDVEPKMAVEIDARLKVDITEKGPMQQNHAFLWVGNLSAERSIQVLALHLTPSYSLNTDEKTEPFQLLVGPNTEEIRDVQQIVARHCRGEGWTKFRISYRAIGDEAPSYTKPRCYSIVIQSPSTNTIDQKDCAEIEKAVNGVQAGADEQD